MWIDIICAGLLGYAFITGFQKGVLKTFGIWISGALACLLSIWTAPPVILFIENSLTLYQSVFDIWILFVLFILSLVLVYMIIRSIMKRQSENGNFISKISGGLLFMFFMVGSLVVMLTFVDKVNLVSQEVKDQSKAYHFSNPMKERTAAVLLQLKQNVHQIKEEEG